MDAVHPRGLCPAIINPLKGGTPYGWHFEQNVYDAHGLVRALKSSEGSGNIPKVIEVYACPTLLIEN